MNRMVRRKPAARLAAWTPFWRGLPPCVWAWLTLGCGLPLCAWAWPALAAPSRIGGGPVKDEILALEDSAMEAWRQGDPRRWVEISADSVVYIDPGLDAPVVGKPAYRRYLEPLAGKIFYDGSEYVDPLVAVFGKTAVLTYNYHSLRNDPSGRPERTSFWNTTEVYRRTDHGWRIVHTHWSYIQHQAPESLAISIPAAAPQTGALKEDAAEVWQLETSALERWSRGDPQGFLALAAPEITTFDAQTPARLNGLEALRQDNAGRAGEIRIDRLEFGNPWLQVFEDSVVLFYQFLAMALHPDGSVKSRTAWNATRVYIRTGGRWQIVHAHWSLVQGQREGGGI